MSESKDEKGMLAIAPLEDGATIGIRDRILGMRSTESFAPSPERLLPALRTGRSTVPEE